MLYWVYQFLLCFFTLLFLPFFLIHLLFTRKHSVSLPERLGLCSHLLKKQIDRKKVQYWIHCVSVGELFGAEALIDQFLEKKNPEYQMVITTTTLTGQNLAQRMYRDRAVVAYFPLDYFFSLWIFFRQIRPKLIMIMETELWPGLFYKAKVPLVILNARMSDRSFRKNSFLRYFFKPFLKKITLTIAQSIQYKERFVHLGCSPDKIVVCDNFKYAASLNRLEKMKNNPIVQTMLDQKNDNCLVIMCASTHFGEEESFLKIFKDVLFQNKTDVCLFLVPRHSHRSLEIEDMISKQKLSWTLYSEYKEKISPLEKDRVYLVDTIGDLFGLYSLADIVIMGGSFIAHGGQNLIEPAVWGKSIIVGPDMHNFSNEVDDFLNNDAIISTKGWEDCQSQLISLLDQPSVRVQMGERAKACVQKKGHSVEKAFRMIQSRMVSH